MFTQGQNWRETTSRIKWPLAEGATGGVGNQKVPDSLFLDMRTMVPYPAEPPFHIRSIGGSDGNMIISIADIKGIVVATSSLSPEGDGVVLVETIYGNPAGVVVVDTGMVSTLAGGLEGREWVYSPEELPLAPAACVSYTPSGFQAVTDGVRSVVGQVDMEARNGVHFVVDGSAIRIDLYGEAPPISKTVKTVNGESVQHLWLASEPESELRVTGTRITTRRNS